MGSKKDLLIAYLAKNLKIAEDRLQEITEINNKITDLKEKIDKLEKELAGFEDINTIENNISEIKGFIDDLTVPEPIIDTKIENNNEIEATNNIENQVKDNATYAFNANNGITVDNTILFQGDVNNVF